MATTAEAWSSAATSATDEGPDEEGPVDAMGALRTRLLKSTAT